MTGKFKIGDKIKIPKQKTFDGIDHPLETCSLIKKYNQLKIKPEFCYIIHVSYVCYFVGFKLDDIGTTFLEKDLEFFDDFKEIEHEIYNLLDLKY